jgi:hypothetical protein
MFSKRKDSGFLFGCADEAAADGRRDNNIYEVNPWLWQFGRGKPRLPVDGLTIEKTTGRKNAVRDERLKRGWETHQRCISVASIWDFAPEDINHIMRYTRV